MSSVASHIIDVLVEAGVDTVFGIPGGAISKVYAELADRSEIKIVNAVHETNAVFLAMGYALATGRPGVALTTAGPGVTNALTGLASAYADGVPVLLISGEVPRSNFGRGALQEGSAHGFDAMAMARPVTKVAMQIARPQSAAAQVKKALATMMSGKTGPAFISLPLDMQTVETNQQMHVGSPFVDFHIDRDACREVARLLAAARRPLLLVGSGARSVANRDAVAAFAHKAKMPVITTPKGKSCFAESDPLFVGVLGFGGHESVIEYLNAEPDVVVVVGSSLNDFATNAWTPKLKGTQAFIQIDIDSSQIGKNYPVDIGLLGPMQHVLDSICSELDVLGEIAPRAPHPTMAFQDVAASPRNMPTTAEVVRMLNEACPKNAVFTSDMGEHLGVMIHLLRTRTAGAFLTCLGFGSMGSGVVSAIGHAMGDKTRRVFAVCGDGGFLMSGNELQTAVHHNVNVTFVIINDGRYNMCHHGIKDIFGKDARCVLGAVDFASVARAFGATGVVVNNMRELIDGLHVSDGPVVLDVRIDPDMRLAGNQRVASVRQFSEGKV